MTGARNAELANQPLELSSPGAAHSIPRGLPCLLSGLAAQWHVRWTGDSPIQREPLHNRWHDHDARRKAADKKGRMTPGIDASTELLELVTHAIVIALDTRSKNRLLTPMCLLVTPEGKLDIIALQSESTQPTEDFARSVLKGRDAARYVFYYEATVEENGQKR